MTPTPRPIAVACTVGLLVWGVGVQTLEGVASAGLAVTVAAVLADVLRRRADLDIKAFSTRWRWLWLFAAWALVGPLLAGHAPAGVGVGRLFDLVALPAAVRAWELVSARQRRIVGWALAGTLLASCLFTGFQHFGVMPELAFWGPVHRVLPIPYDRVYEPVPGHPGRFMGGGFQFHRLKFAHVAGLGAIALAAMAMQDRARRVPLALLAGLTLWAMLSFASVRAASVAALVGGGLAIVLLSQSRRRALALCAALAALGAGLVAATPALRERFASSFTAEGSGERTVILQAGWRAYETSPLVGIGLGRFRLGDWVPETAGGDLRHHGGKTHDQFFTFLVETGLPGLLLFLAFLVALARATPSGTPAGAAGLAALAYFALLSLLHDPLFHAEFSMAFVLLLGWALAVPPGGRPEASEAGRG